MKNFLKLGGAGHRSWTSDDKLLEWKEPSVIRKKVLVREIWACLIILPILFPIFGVVGFFLFAAKVWSKGHSLKEVPWGGLVLVSLMLATIFSLFLVIKIVFAGLSPIIVRLASEGIAIWKSGWERKFSCEYEEIRSVALAKHDVVSEVPAIRVVLKSGDPVYLAGSHEELGKALEIFNQRGVQVDTAAKS